MLYMYPILFGRQCHPDVFNNMPKKVRQKLGGGEKREKMITFCLWRIVELFSTALWDSPCFDKYKNNINDSTYLADTASLKNETLASCS